MEPGAKSHLARLGAAVIQPGMPLFQTQGQTLHYTIENNAFSEDVLFVHGNLASARWWQPTIQFLEKNRVAHMQGRLVAVDWPGCGQSLAPKRAEDVSMWSLAHDHIALAKGCGLHKICLVGHSAGGLIALMMMLLEPELFSKALLLDPVSAQGIDMGSEMLDAYQHMSQDRKFCEMILSGTVHGRDPKDPFVQKLVDDAFGADRLIWNEVPKALAQIDLRKDLKKIQQPTLVLHGELDRVLPVSGSREIAELIPNGEFELLKGRGHCANIEDPALIADKIQTFFG
jgi:pimeloyl-ACP methyl ester carboxylesterase